MWRDPDTAIGGNRDRFPSTQVSPIASAAGEPLAMERVVGAMIGFLTQKMGTSAPVRRSS